MIKMFKMYTRSSTIAAKNYLNLFPLTLLYASYRNLNGR